MMDQQRLPNLFIIGAPKCGTTAMSHYLAGHPDIFMSETAGVKEPAFYTTDRQLFWRPIHTRVDYEALFSEAPQGVSYIGEASTTYLESDAAVPNILLDSPDAKFIVMVRNPIDIAAALHNQHVKKSREIHDFKRAWRLQFKQPGEWELPPKYGNKRADDMQYGRIAKIGFNLERLYTRVRPSQVYVIVYDDFAEDPKREYVNLLDWLELRFDERKDFSVINARVTYRVPVVEQGLTAIRRFRDRFNLPGGFGINAIIDRFNVVEKCVGFEPEFKKELATYFRDDVELLSRIMNRNFSSWLG